jgi:hypothetical protein
MRLLTVSAEGALPAQRAFTPYSSPSQHLGLTIMTNVSIEGHSGPGADETGMRGTINRLHGVPIDTVFRHIALSRHARTEARQDSADLRW